MYFGRFQVLTGRQGALQELVGAIGAGMRKKIRSKKNPAKSIGREAIASLKEAIAWAGGENVPVNVTTLHVAASDLRKARGKVN